jgi:hypothetical protein
VVVGIAQPLHEERQLRVVHQVVDADLPPLQVDAVGPDPVPVDGRAAQPPLDRGDVVDRDHPPEPASAVGSPPPHRLTERRAIGGGVVERATTSTYEPPASGSTKLRVPKRGWRPPSENAPPIAEPSRCTTSSSSYGVAAYDT